MKTDIVISFQVPGEATRVEFEAEVMVKPSTLRMYLQSAIKNKSPFLMSVYPSACAEQLALPFSTTKGK